MLAKKEKKESSTSGWLDVGLQCGTTLAVSVLAMTLGGKWLDDQFGTTPVFLIIGALWGAVGGTVWVVLRVKRYGDSLEPGAPGDEGEGA